MKVSKFPGFFVDIEGLDGCGASTQVALLAVRLRKEKIPAFITKEPTAGPVGDLVRSALRGGLRLSPASFQLLFAADRGEHLDNDIIPRLKKGQMVVTDRYAWSSVAFGSVDLSREWLFELNRDFILPDLTIFIEVPPAVCLARLRKERGGLELVESESRLGYVWSTYHFLSAKYWWANIVMIDGNRPREEVHREIFRIIKDQSKFSALAR